MNAPDCATLSSTATRNGHRLDLGALQANQSPVAPPIAVDADGDHLLPVVGTRHGTGPTLQSGRTHDSYPNADVHAGIVGTR